MGNLCLRPVVAVEARSVGELARRVVDSKAKEHRVGDLEKIIQTSAAGQGVRSFAVRLLYFRSVLAVVEDGRCG